MLKTYARLLQNTVRTISNWKTEKRPIISLLEKYFSKTELEEFLETGGIEKFEALEGLSIEDVKFILDNKEIVEQIKTLKAVLTGENTK